MMVEDPQGMTLRDKVARSCYTSYHETGRRLAPNFDLTHDFEKLRWLMTADRVLAQLPDIATLTSKIAIAEESLRVIGKSKLKKSTLRAALDCATIENIVLRSFMGGGCDANDDRHHEIVGDGKGAFCHMCGQMTRNGKSNPWFNEDRIDRAISRLASRPHPTRSDERYR
jgi:hypothetical protein